MGGQSDTKTNWKLEMSKPFNLVDDEVDASALYDVFVASGRKLECHENGEYATTLIGIVFAMAGDREFYLGYINEGHDSVTWAGLPESLLRHAFQTRVRVKGDEMEVEWNTPVLGWHTLTATGEMGAAGAEQQLAFLFNYYFNAEHKK